MLLVSAVLLDSGLYEPLLKIINAYAWESHMDAKWKMQYTKGMERLQQLRPVQPEYNDYLHYFRVNDWHILVLLSETKHSFLITENIPAFRGKKPDINETTKQIVIYQSNKAEFESWCSSVSNWREWQIVMFIGDETDPSDWKEYHREFKVFHNDNWNRYMRAEHFIM